VSQSKRNARGDRTKVTLRCRQYYHTNESHNPSIDPAEQRTSKSVRNDCYARVNLNRIGGTDLWKVTLVDFQHNHERELVEGGSAPPRVTDEHRDFISKFVTAPTTSFSRSQLSAALKASFPTQAPLEPRQISNVINSVKREADAAVQALGGDVMAVLAMLQTLKDADPNWVFYVLLDDQQRLVALWWQNPVQAELTRRYSDVLLNDNTYNRNKYNFPLNIGIIIDGFGHSRNAWYCFQEVEDADTHAWVFRNHLQSAGRAPDALISDRSPAIILAASRTMPTTSHIYCLYHLEGNITTNLRPVLGAAWEAFKAKFWDMYLSPAPESFEQRWSTLIDEYPLAEQYLAELYGCKERWAYAWVMTMFTAGTRTNGRVESENRVNKGLGGPKKNFKQFVEALNERSGEQTVNDMIEVRQVCSTIT
jgi:hypothetical protein